MNAPQTRRNPIQGLPIIPFCRPTVAMAAERFIGEALQGSMSGGGHFTQQCHRLLRHAVPGASAFITSSCTDALELAALALDLQPGDEIVMPSWTFPSSANAFALRGAIPVFVDIEPGTLNIDPTAAAAAITSRTRALLCVHYAGVACDMERLKALCGHHDLALVEDAAQAYGAFWHDKPLGGLGDFGAFSFHGSKNVSCGEGGALMTTRGDLLARVEAAWEKGTNRLDFGLKKQPFYQWVDLGSSFLPSELTAALLAAQLAEACAITAARRRAWQRYAALLEEADIEGLQHAKVPHYAVHNAHIFAVQVRESAWRPVAVAALAAEGIEARSHYHPLHLSQAGQRLCRTSGTLTTTEAAAARMFRLPIDAHITAVEQERVVGVLVETLRRLRQSPRPAST